MRNLTKHSREELVTVSGDVVVFDDDARRQVAKERHSLGWEVAMTAAFAVAGALAPNLWKDPSLLESAAAGLIMAVVVLLLFRKSEKEYHYRHTVPRDFLKADVVRRQAIEDSLRSRYDKETWIEEAGRFRNLVDSYYEAIGIMYSAFVAREGLANESWDAAIDMAPFPQGEADLDSPMWSFAQAVYSPNVASPRTARSYYEASTCADKLGLEAFRKFDRNRREVGDRFEIWGMFRDVSPGFGGFLDRMMAGHGKALKMYAYFAYALRKAHKQPDSQPPDTEWYRMGVEYMITP